MPRFSLDPTTETAVQTVKRTRFTYRYAYARSADSKANDDTGQDYLTVWHNDEQFIFVLCDGVSQSFYGDVGARFLAENLAGWLTQLPATSLQDFHDALTQRLTSLTQEATAYVNRVNVPADAPEILREVLAQKREGGSQTTFICGRVLFELDSSENGRLYLAWMGDSKLRLWDAGGECSHILGGQFITQERWSTKTGPIGTLHSCSLPLAPVDRLIAYSDGLDLLDEQTAVPDTEALNNLIHQATQSPTSDDITLLDLQFYHTVPSRAVAPTPPAHLVVHPDPHQLHIAWNDAPRPDHYYQLEIRQPGQPPYIRQVDTNQWSLKPYAPGTNYQFRVRAIRGTTPGAWSEPYQITTPVTASTAGTARSTPGTTRSFAAPFAWAAMGILVLLLTVTGYAWWSGWSTTDDPPPVPVAEVVPLIEPSATWPPTPTIALAAVATGTPYEGHTVTLIPTDEPTAVSTNTPEPTATATVTPEPDENLSPTLVAEDITWPPSPPTPEIDFARCYMIETELTYWLDPSGDPAGTFVVGTITYHVDQRHTEIDFGDEINTQVWVQIFFGGEFRWITEETFNSEAVLPTSCPY